MTFPATTPIELQNRLTSIFQTMQARGILDTFDVYSRSTDTTNGKATARKRQKIATLMGYVPTGSGSNVPGMEGVRVDMTHQLYFLDDPSCTEANYKDRWIVFTSRSQIFYRILHCQGVGGLFTWAMLEEGSVTDAAGNIR